MTQQEENYKNIMIARDSQSEAMVFEARDQLAMVGNGVYKICGRYGLEEATGYPVIGYPPGWVIIGHGRGGDRNNRGGLGHTRGRGYNQEVASTVVHREAVSSRMTYPSPGTVTSLRSAMKGTVTSSGSS